MKLTSLPYELVTTSTIAVNYVNNTKEIEGLFPNHFRNPKLRNLNVDRERIVEKLLTYNRKIGGSQQVLRNIKSLLNTNTYAVITGQQPGIFSGPLYTIYKAFSTIILCERLSNHSKHYVPIFWNASEDDDFLEINSISLFEGNKVNEISYKNKVFNVTFSNLYLDHSNLFEMLTIVDKNTPDSEFKSQLLKEISKIIKNSSRIGDFFSRFMDYLFKDYGLIIIEPYCLRELMVPVFERLIKRPRECTNILSKTNKKIKDLGYSPRIHKVSNLCNFFIINNKGERLRVTYNKDFLVGKDKFTKKDLLSLLDENPTRFSANTIIRPITQDYIFPTFAYVAGPHEITYYAQLKGIYNFFSLEMPVIYPRFGATIIESKISKLLEKYNIIIHELMNKEKLLKNLAKESIESTFKKLRTKVHEDLDEAFSELIAIDKKLVSQCEITKKKLLKDIQYLEAKTASNINKKRQITRQQITKAYNNVFPYGELQERRINILEYLIKFGRKFLETIYLDLKTAKYGEHVVIKC
jgi:bacillithiol biosynthesis cysteine-adding enzyme BshC